MSLAKKMNKDIDINECITIDRRISELIYPIKKDLMNLRVYNPPNSMTLHRYSQC